MPVIFDLTGYKIQMATPNPQSFLGAATDVYSNTKTINFL